MIEGQLEVIKGKSLVTLKAAHKVQDRFCHHGAGAGRKRPHRFHHVVKATTPNPAKSHWW